MEWVGKVPFSHAGQGGPFCRGDIKGEEMTMDKSGGES